LPRERGNTCICTLGGEERSRFEPLLEILLEIDKRRLEKLLRKRWDGREPADSILDDPDRKILRSQRTGKLKRYNLTQTTKILGISRQSLYYWIRKGWVRVKKDGRGYPIFTVFDIKRIMSWRNFGADGSKGARTFI